MCVSSISIDELLIADIAREHIDDECGIGKFGPVVGLAPEFFFDLKVARLENYKI